MLLRAQAAALEQGIGVLVPLTVGHNFPDSEWYSRAYSLVKTGGAEPSENQGSWISKAFKKVGLG